MVAEKDGKPDMMQFVDDERIFQFVESFRHWTQLSKVVMKSRRDRPKSSVMSNSLRKRARWMNNSYSSPGVGEFLMSLPLDTDEIPHINYARNIGILIKALDEAEMVFRDDELDLARVHLVRALGNTLNSRLSGMHPPGVDKKEVARQREVVDAIVGIDDIPAYYTDVLNACLCFMKADEITGCMTPETADMVYQLTMNPGLERINEYAAHVYFGIKGGLGMLTQHVDKVSTAVFSDLQAVAAQRGLSTGKNGSPLFLHRES